ncbi:MAG: bifunctional precorrin-2 dehydrogenase/sirohydrochlorin ferrochelatase [Actinomycetota bacterium]
MTATYPAQLDLRDRPALLVGAGTVATDKLARLLPTGARIAVVAPEAAPPIAALADDGAIRWHRRPYRRGEVAAYRLAITATDDPAVNHQVFLDGEAANVFVNSADDPDNCSFILPAAARRGPISVNIGTEGRSPALAGWLRRRYQADLDDGMLDLLDLLMESRAELRRCAGTSEHDGWAPTLDDGLLDLVRVGRVDEARARLRAALGLDDPRAAADVATRSGSEVASDAADPHRSALKVAAR